MIFMKISVVYKDYCRNTFVKSLVIQPGKKRNISLDKEEILTYYKSLVDITMKQDKYNLFVLGSYRINIYCRFRFTEEVL